MDSVGSPSSFLDNHAFRWRLVEREAVDYHTEASWTNEPVVGRGTVPCMMNERCYDNFYPYTLNKS